ncbi:MAG: glycosyl transferase family 2 [Bacteroides sp. 43_108]|nr:MAG: glycosyl transferase family 2 [Bacteroides sp. 43_108]
MCRLAVVILNWNGAEMMKEYLPSVVRCSVSDQVDVYVADNGSTDNSLELLRNDFPDVKIIELDKNYGFAEGYNKAFVHIDAEYYLLLNSDVEIRQKGWLEPMISYMDLHPEVAACQPKLLSLRYEGQFEYAGASGGFIDRYGYPYCRGRVFDVVEADKGQYDDIVQLFWATGAALMVRSSDYWNAGGLDGRFFAHMEEIDFCWRLRSLGREIVCIPQSEAYHLGGATLSKENPRKTFLNFRNNLLMLYKNLPQSELRYIMTTRMILDGVAALQFALKGEFGNFKAVWKAHNEFRRLRPDFVESRKKNMDRCVLSDIPERRRFFLLWSFFVRMRRTYNQLPFSN